MFKKIKTKFEAIRDFLEEPYLEEHSLGEICVKSFFEGSGKAAWILLIALNLILVITGNELSVVPKKK